MKKTDKFSIVIILPFLMIFASSCALQKNEKMKSILTGCPPYQDEVAFPTEGPLPELEPDYLDKMYKKIKNDFEDAGIDLEKITNGFKSKGIIIERQKGEDGYTKELTVSLDGDIAFASGSADLTPKARELVSNLGDALQEFQGTLASIEGHTDSDGSSRLNLQLSQRRAMAVKNELVDVKQIATERIVHVEGYGETRPIAPNTTPEGKAKNRRVEIKIVPGKTKTEHSSFEFPAGRFRSC